MLTMLTDKEIRALRADAGLNGDERLVHTCDTALAYAEDGDEVGQPLTDWDGKPTTRTAAREACARVVASLRTLMDGP